MTLRDRCDPGRANLVRRLANEVDAIEPDASCERRQHAGHPQHERRLAGSVGTEQRRHVAGMELDVDVADDDPFPSCDAEALDDQVVAHTSSNATPRYAARTFGSLSDAAVGP